MEKIQKPMLFVLNEKGMDTFAGILCGLPNDGKYEVVLRPHKTTRSVQQNSLYWKWVTILGDFCGYDKDDMHEVLGEEYLEKREFTDRKGRKYRRPVSTAGLSVKDFSDYLNKIEGQAISMGVALPSPSVYGYDW
jgi:hypothetical protein